MIVSKSSRFVCVSRAVSAARSRNGELPDDRTRLRRHPPQIPELRPARNFERIDVTFCLPQVRLVVQSDPVVSIPSRGRAMVRTEIRLSDRAAARRLAIDSIRRPHADGSADRFRQNAGGLPGFTRQLFREGLAGNWEMKHECCMFLPSKRLATIFTKISKNHLRASGRPCGSAAVEMWKCGQRYAPVIPRRRNDKPSPGGRLIFWRPRQSRSTCC